MAVVLDGSPLAIEQVAGIARGGLGVKLAESARPAIEKANRIVARHADDSEAIYGVNTGFGSLSRVRISADEVREVQRNLIRSHAAGVGEPLDEQVVRAMLAIQAASLARGYSGVRPALIEQIIALLNAGVTPVVPSRGSVGASGDLAPLAHAALVLVGEGHATLDGETTTGGEALRRAGVEPITLEAKEGLALINGTHLMCAIGALTLADLANLCDAAMVSAAMAIDACRGSDAPLDARIHEARCQLGQQQVAARLRDLLSDSQIIPSHRGDADPRVQDPYCLRATPQVLGAALDAIDHARLIIERELGAVTDNPLVFPAEVGGDGSANDAGTILSGGNFHGMPLAITLDSLSIAITHIAGIAERRIYWLLAASDSENPVNIYLSPQPGLHSGLMIVQYTAAACVNELQTLAAPASVGNIPTSAGIEDYNSMGATAAHQLRAGVALARHVIAMELLTMCEALEYQRPLRSGTGVERAYEAVRTVVPKLDADRPPSPDIAAIGELIRAGAFSDDA